MKVPLKKKMITIAIFSTYPLSSEILGDIENLFPGMEV